MIKSEIIPRIGKRIKELRKEKNIKLFQLAEKSGISRGLLSKIENGRSIPSLPVCFEIIKNLDIKLEDFFKDVDLKNIGSYKLVKKGEGIKLDKEDGIGFDYKKLIGVDICNHNVDFVILTLEPEANREFVNTDGFEYIYMLSGDIEYYLGSEKLVLSEGDSLFFDGRVPHVPKNNSGKQAKLLIVYMIN